MPTYSHQDILQLERFFRVNLVNTASGIRSPYLIGTSDKDGNTNLAIFNSVVHIGAKPPALGFIMRPHTVERHTYENIKASGVFTLNLVHSDIIENAHQTSASYPRDRSEFESCGFQEQYLQGFSAPFVQECELKIGLSLLEEHLIEFNQTIILIGQIDHLIVPDSCVKQDGSIDHDRLNTVGVSGLYSYYDTQLNRQLDFVRPEKSS